MPTRERAALPAQGTEPAAAPNSLLNLDVPTRERAALPVQASVPEPEPPEGRDASAEAIELPSAAHVSEDRIEAFTSSDSIGMLEPPIAEPRTVELEIPPEVAAALRATTKSQPAPTPLDDAAEAEAAVGDPSEVEAEDHSFLSSASLKADEARRQVGENAARVRRERDADERAARERARQARQPETLEQKRQRIALRLRTVREGVRLLGFMGIADAIRTELEEALGEVDAALLPDAATGRPGTEGGLDGRIQTLEAADLDRIDRPLTLLEDLAVQADASVPRDVFRERAFSGKHNRKTLTRYGRLLASRRFSADRRRDRFEYLVTHLLTQADAAGRLAMLPKEESRTVLQHLIGGLPQLGAERDREDAITYLKDALTRLAEFPNDEAFFESGFFLDVHGYKVSMRDQLTSADFLYLSALLSARLHNRLEEWIAAKEKDRKANQLTQEGSPRERIMGLLREQEETVQSIFGAETAAPAKDAPVKRAAPKKQAKQASADRKKEEEKWKKRKAALAAKNEPPSVTKVAVLVGIIVVSALIVLRSTGNLTIQTRFLVEPAKLRSFSPLLVRGFLEDDGRTFYGDVKLGSWQGMDDQQRTAAAQELASKLAAAGVERAEIKAFHDTAIRIDAHLVSSVQQAKR
jgi:hypothetical protein